MPHATPGGIALGLSGVRSACGPRDFAVALADGRGVIGRALEHDWHIHVYAATGERRLLGYGTARTRPLALHQAGLSGEDAGEILGPADI